MPPLLIPLGRVLGVLLGVLVAATAYGQAIVVARVAQRKAPQPAAAPPPASAHRLVILQGPRRSVHYITTGSVSTSDRLAVYELERTENALEYYRDLQSLKNQYASSERFMEPVRHLVQKQLYGAQVNSYGSATAYTGGSAGGGWGSPFVWGGYGYPRSFGGYTGTTSYQVIRSLQFGMGDEGQFKSMMLRSMAEDASTAQAPVILRAYDSALTRAAGSPMLSRDLGLRKGATPPEAREPSFTKGSNVTVWIGNEKQTGVVKADHDGWLVLQTTKAELTVRKSEITRVEVATKQDGK